MKQDPALPPSNTQSVDRQAWGEHAWVVSESYASGRVDLRLQRPDCHNAFNAEIIKGLRDAIRHFSSQNSARVLVLASEGEHFSAGADLNWMGSMVEASYEDNLADSEALAQLMEALEGCPRPVICRVQGSAFGGAIGLIACSDVAVGTRQGHFCLSEVKLGLIPAVISPYVLRAIGARAMRRHTLVADVFDGEAAARLGLLHECVDALDLDATIEKLVERLLANGPEAVGIAKRLLREIDGQALGSHLRGITTRAIADRRVSQEGQEGMKAFLEKRRPRWAPK